MKKIEIALCMGSSCFARGNNKNLEALQNYIQEHHLEEQITLKGHLCEEVCKKGPVVNIDGQIYYEVNPQILEQTLDAIFFK